MLTVRDIAALPGLGLATAAGAAGLDRQVTWLHVSELPDPTEWLEGGELLLSTGLGFGRNAAEHASYVRRLAEHGLAGLGLGLGFDFAEVPPGIAEEAELLSFPVLTVPYEVPFEAITKATFTRLADARLRHLTAAQAVNEQLVAALLDGRGLRRLLGITASHLECSLALVDDDGRVLADAGRKRGAESGAQLVLPVVAGSERATLEARRDGTPFDEYDRLVLHHAQTALAFELSRREAVSAAELRLAGDLLEDLEQERIGDRDAARRMAAFGLRPDRRYAALFAVPTNGVSAEQLRREVAEELDRRTVSYVSTAQRDRAAFLVEADTDEEIVDVARRILDAEPDARIGVGRPAQGTALSRSLLEARAALRAETGDVATYRDLGSLELLLDLPPAALEAFVARVLGPAAGNGVLLDSLRALLDTGCRWTDAAERLGVHRHTLRYRMERLREVTGRHPDDPADRMDLWLAVKASDAVRAREGAIA